MERNKLKYALNIQLFATPQYKEQERNYHKSTVFVDAAGNLIDNETKILEVDPGLGGMVPLYKKLANPSVAVDVPGKKIKVMLQPKSDNFIKAEDLMAVRTRRERGLLKRTEIVEMKGIYTDEVLISKEDLRIAGLEKMVAIEQANQIRSMAGIKDVDTIDKLVQAAIDVETNGYVGMKGQQITVGQNGVAHRIIEIDKAQDAEATLKLLADLTGYVGELGGIRHPEYAYAYANGQNKDNLKCITTNTFIQSLILKGGRLASEIGNRDISTGQFNGNNQLWNKMWEIEENISARLADGREVAAIVMLGGVKSPLIAAADGETPAFRMEPDYKGNSKYFENFRTDHRFGLDLLDEYKPVVFLLVYKKGQAKYDGLGGITMTATTPTATVAGGKTGIGMNELKVNIVDNGNRIADQHKGFELKVYSDSGKTQLVKTLKGNKLTPVITVDGLKNSTQYWYSIVVEVMDANNADLSTTTSVIGGGTFTTIADFIDTDN